MWSAMALPPFLLRDLAEPLLWIARGMLNRRLEGIVNAQRRTEEDRIFKERKRRWLACGGELWVWEEYRDVVLFDWDGVEESDSSDESDEDMLEIKCVKRRKSIEWRL